MIKNWESKIAAAAVIHHPLFPKKYATAVHKKSRQASSQRLPKIGLETLVIGNKVSPESALIGAKSKAFVKPIRCIKPCKTSRLMNKIFMVLIFAQGSAGESLKT